MAIALLSTLKHALGDLDRVKRVVKVVGFVNSAPDFTDQPAVVNGASDFFVEVFGDKGKHARSAVGMVQLPGGIPVEVEMVIEIEDNLLRKLKIGIISHESAARNEVEGDSGEEDAKHKTTLVTPQGK